jgi:hypothetical protein
MPELGQRLPAATVSADHTQRIKPDQIINMPGPCWFPYAGKFYEFSETREDYLSFYEAAVKDNGWLPVDFDGSSEQFCYIKKLGGATAVLSVAAHGVDGVQGYDIGIAAYGEDPGNGGLLC